MLITALTLPGGPYGRSSARAHARTVRSRAHSALYEGTQLLATVCAYGMSNTAASGIVGNPYDKTRSAGGSTSGCAVLLVTGEADLAIGGDQGGSIRIVSSV